MIIIPGIQWKQNNIRFFICNEHDYFSSKFATGWYQKKRKNLIEKFNMNLYFTSKRDV